jgi:hypothetical protein
MACSSIVGKRSVVRHVIHDLKAIVLATGCVPWMGETHGVDASWEEMLGLEQLT